MDPFSPPITAPINFLAKLFQNGTSYSALCTARSALSSYLEINDFGNLDCVKRFMKGVFEQRPSIPLRSKVETWDPQQVIEFLEPWYPHESLSLKDLTLKLTMFLAILSGQRCQTIHSLDINEMKIQNGKCTFYVTKLLKHSKRGNHQRPIEFLSFPENKKLCIVDMLKAYIKKTHELRKDSKCTNLLISFQKPFRPVSKDSVKRWIKLVMEMAGIDTTKFTAHSTRAASTSGAFNVGVPIQTILSAAGWSQQSTFAKFYHKEIKSNMGQKLLEAYFSKAT